MTLKETKIPKYVIKDVVSLIVKGMTKREDLLKALPCGESKVREVLRYLVLNDVLEAHKEVRTIIDYTIKDRESIQIILNYEDDRYTNLYCGYKNQTVIDKDYKLNVLKDMIDNNLSRSEICAKYNICRATLSKWCAEYTKVVVV